MPDSLMSTAAAAAYLGMVTNTLKKWRIRHEGPPYIKTGPDDRAAVRYRRSDLDAWLESRTVRPTRPVLPSYAPRSPD